MLDKTSSETLAVRRLASCYIRQMRPISDIRRDNLAILVGAEPSQAAFARKIGKDKNQVNQWLGRAGSRNLSSETAREIESKLAKPAGWMDQDRSPDAVNTADLAESQSVGFDVDRMQSSIAFLEQQFETWGKDFVASERSVLIAEVYRRKGLSTPPSPIELSQWLAEQLKPESDDAEGQRVGSTGSNDRARDQRRSA